MDREKKEYKPPRPKEPTKGEVVVTTQGGEKHHYPAGTAFTTDKMIPTREGEPQTFERTGELYITNSTGRLAVYGAGQWGSVRVIL